MIHADLSEYNVLVSDDKIWLIDVGQAVELDHPQTFYFLKRDIENIYR